MSETGWPKTLYPHGGEREWSTEMCDEWKRDLGVDVVPADHLADLAAENERLKVTADNFWAAIETLATEIEALRALREANW